MIDINQIVVSKNTSLRDALDLLNKTGSGVLLMLNQEGLFDRTVTDGDIRRLLLESISLDDTLAPLENVDSIVIKEGYVNSSALELMNKHYIDHLPVIDAEKKVVGIIHRKELDEQILLSTPHLGDLERAYVEEAFSSNWIAPLGPNVDAFENEFVEYIGGGYAAAVNSGTAAIHLALRLLGVSAGDIVFCSSFTFVASANPIIYQHAEPVFIDSEPDSWNMSAVALEKAFIDAKAISKLPKAVIVVNLYGQSANMDDLLEICNRYEVPVIEDAAESLGATYKGKSSGTLGTMGIYSFNGNKIITTSGGGMLVSNNHELIEKARFLATQARDSAPHYQHSELGFNYRMSNILAGVGRGQLKVLDERVHSRRYVYEQYRQGLSHIKAIEWMPEPDWSYATRWLSVCKISLESTVSAKKLINTLSEHNIEARHAWKPLHMQPLFSGTKYYAHGNSSISDALFQQGVCLPSGSNMNDNQIQKVINVIDELFSNTGLV